MKIHTSVILTISILLFISFASVDNTSTPNTSKLVSAVPVYRILDKYGYHFYTTNEAEKNSVIKDYGFKLEGILGYVFSEQIPGTIPLYRYNGVIDVYDRDNNLQSSRSRHYYTTDNNDDNVKPKGEALGDKSMNIMSRRLGPEGVLGYISSTQVEGTVPIFKLFQFNLQDFKYKDQKIQPAIYDQLLTNDEKEKYSAQQTYGYKDAGILGYIWSSPEKR